LAQHEWARLKANDSLECRNCHSDESMDITRQSPRAADFHQRLLFTGEKTCIDCHKGIAHELPNMKEAAAPSATVVTQASVAHQDDLRHYLAQAANH